jgi:hypothetical protein
MVILKSENMYIGCISAQVSTRIGSLLPARGVSVGLKYITFRSGRRLYLGVCACFEGHGRFTFVRAWLFSARFEGHGRFAFVRAWLFGGGGHGRCLFSAVWRLCVV